MFLHLYTGKILSGIKYLLKKFKKKSGTWNWLVGDGRMKKSMKKTKTAPVRINQYDGKRYGAEAIFY